MSFCTDVFESWNNIEGNVNSQKEIFDWITDLNLKTTVTITPSLIGKDTYWFLENGIIRNKNNSFFVISGIREYNGEQVREQPIIVQNEVGYLGIVCKKINGVLNFLMQAKIEPGNVNCVQISPTIQATKSNYTRAHGGKTPAYLNLFDNPTNFKIIYNQLQSEQSSRFFKKRNRNMIIMIDSEIEIYPNFKWMTLGQLKKLMEYDNLVNMDTRTVISGLITCFCLPRNKSEEKLIKEIIHDDALFNSMFSFDKDEYYQTVNLLDEYKKHHHCKTQLIPIHDLKEWEMTDFGIKARTNADFCVSFYDIFIQGREVTHWSQPLVKACGRATFALFFKNFGGQKKCLIKLKPEIGVYDCVEFGPTIQRESTYSSINQNVVEDLFDKVISENKASIKKYLLSEEGGRFYHEENYNYIIEIDDDVCDLPNEYCWVNLSTLSELMKKNNYLNIQLRNLLSLITFKEND